MTISELILGRMVLKNFMTQCHLLQQRRLAEYNRSAALV